MKIPLGVYVKDKLTGLVGLTENYATYLGSCPRYFVQPVAKDGSLPTGLMVDEQQLERIGQRGINEHWHKPRLEVVEPEPQEVLPGDKVEDKVLGTVGVVTASCIYINGCRRVYVEHGTDKPDGVWL